MTRVRILIMPWSWRRADKKLRRVVRREFPVPRLSLLITLAIEIKNGGGGEREREGDNGTGALCMANCARN